MVAAMRIGRRGVGALALALTTGMGGIVLLPSAAQADPAEADVSVTVTHAPTTVTTGDEVTFTLTGTNAGPGPAAAVVLGLSYGYPLSLVSADADCRLSYGDGNSVLCAVGTIASGESATATIKLRPSASGVYTIPAAASSTTPDPDSADLAATDTMLVRRGPSQGERYILAVFPIILGRDPDSSSLTFWANRFFQANNHYPRHLETVPLGIISSNEYRRIRIREAYVRILGRPASATDVAYWLAKSNGGLSYEAIERRMITSKEFSAKHGQDPADPTIAAYHVLLGRAPTQAEIEAFALDYANGKTFAAVVLKVQRSTESYDLLIADRYQKTLGHAPSAVGRYGWQIRLRQGVSPERLWAELLVSGEVLQKYPPSEDDYGPPVPIFNKGFRFQP